MVLCTPYVDSAEGRKTICTSATRPTGANVWPGKEIFETDTSRSWIYTSGATWALTHWASTAGRPGVILTDAAQSIPNVTFTDVTWGTEVSDVDGWTSGGSATLTVPTGWDGLYAITYTGTWSAGAGTSNSVGVLINGAAVLDIPNGALNKPSGTICYPLAATNTIKVQGYQSSGGAINLTSRLDIVWLGV